MSKRARHASSEGVTLPVEVWREIFRHCTMSECVQLLQVCHAMSPVLDPLLKFWLQKTLDPLWVGGRDAQWLLAQWLDPAVGPRKSWRQQRFALLSYIVDQRQALSARCWIALIAPILAVAPRFARLCCVMGPDGMYVCCHLTLRPDRQSLAYDCFYSDSERGIVWRPLVDCPEAWEISLQRQAISTLCLSVEYVMIQDLSTKLSDELRRLIASALAQLHLDSATLHRPISRYCPLYRIAWGSARKVTQSVLEHWGTPQEHRLAYHSGAQSTQEKQQGLLLMERIDADRQTLLETLALRCDTFDAWAEWAPQQTLVMYP